MTDLNLLAQELRANGYLVIKIPECRRPEGHGRHILVTRSAICDGVEPIPHGLRQSAQGLFYMWYTCLCGKDFNTEDWNQHKKEHGI